MIGQPDMQGVYNATAPHPVTNRRFTLALAGALHKTVRMPPLPAWLLRALMGEMADLLLASQRVSPERMLERGYSFLYPELDTALNDILTGHAGNVNL
jgi:NAD dependent epimerase/dehydratase family enzyme